MQRFILAVGLLLCGAAVAKADPSITIGNWVVPPNTAGLTIQLYATGNEQASGLDLFNWINGGVAGGPFITAIDFTSPGHLFEGGTTVGYGDPYDVYNGTSTGEATAISVSTNAPITTDGLLVTYTFATVGVSPGVYSWSLVNPDYPGATSFFDSNFELIPTILVDGGIVVPLVSEVISLDGGGATITVVPEPGSMALAALAGAGLTAAALRRRKRRCTGNGA